MQKGHAIALFEGKTVRKIWDSDEWWFSVVDVIAILSDSINPRDYWYKMKVRVKEEDGFEPSTVCRQLKTEALDGKMRETDFSNTELINQGNDPWSIADRIAWDEHPVPSNEIVQRLMTYIEDINLPNQIIHGDIGENIFFHKNLDPAVIDFCPYWRPADFSIAVTMIDAMTWRDAPASILNLCTDIEHFDQLLLRALIRRICEFIEHKRQSGKDYQEDIDKHLPIVDIVIKVMK